MKRTSDVLQTITGIKNVNIRGLGVARTLVLINGKRMVETAVATNSAESPVDIGNFPSIALKRIELLKNGGSTVYGSDAVAGVFNMITRTDFEGFEMNLSTTNINNADPGYNFGFIYGNQNGDNRFTISYEYEEIGRLMNIDLGLVDWKDPTTWPLGASSFGNPGTWHPLAGGAAQGEDAALPVRQIVGWREMRRLPRGAPDRRHLAHQPAAPARHALPPRHRRRREDRAVEDALGRADVPPDWRRTLAV